MMFEIVLPARINILGNPSDGNEGAHQTISAAINVFGSVKVERSDRFCLSFKSVSGEPESDPIELGKDSFSGLSYGLGFDLPVAAIRTLHGYSPEFREKAENKPFSLEFYTGIPRQSGMGGSTVLVLLTMLAMVRHYQLDPLFHNYYVLGELAQRAEERELDITCGFADRYVPLFGGIAYIDYRDKLFHRPVKEEPYCTYEKLDKCETDCPLVICSTGVRHESGDVHRPMRARYLEEYKQFAGDYDQAPFMVRIMKEIGDTAWKGKIALLEGDLDRFGELMNTNHGLVDEMMRHSGFSEGAGEANNRMIRTGMEHGALGAKLTGAGGGGSVFMLVPPGREKAIEEELRKTLEHYGYVHGRVFIPEIVREGAVIREES
ncbi:MAG: hypothetical protein R6V10_10945 [bacterium]